VPNLPSTLRRRACTGVLALALTAAGCTTDGPVASTQGDGDGAVEDGLERYDPTGDAILVQMDALDATVVAARDALREAADADDTAAAQDGVERALALLVAEGTGPASADGPLALLPATTVDRDATGQRPTDLLTASATVAGDDASPRARIVLELLRDPIAGDLGAWSRDPAGMVALVGEVAAEAYAAGADLDAAERIVRGLDGEATRALAYALAARSAIGADDLTLARAHAARGAAHLEVVRLGIGIARDAAIGTDAPARTDAGGAPDAEDESDLEGTRDDGTDRALTEDVAVTHARPWPVGA
jgi:hypothetical protein